MISSLPQHDFKLLQLPLAFGIIVRPRMRGSTISATPAAQSNSFRALLQEAPTRYLFTLLLFGICLDLQNVHGGSLACWFGSWEHQWADTNDTFKNADQHIAPSLKS